MYNSPDRVFSDDECWATASDVTTSGYYFTTGTAGPKALDTDMTGKTTDVYSIDQDDSCATYTGTYYVVVVASSEAVSTDVFELKAEMAERTSGACITSAEIAIIVIVFVVLACICCGIPICVVSCFVIQANASSRRMREQQEVMAANSSLAPQQVVFSPVQAQQAMVIQSDYSQPPQQGTIVQSGFSQPQQENVVEVVSVGYSQPQQAAVVQSASPQNGVVIQGSVVQGSVVQGSVVQGSVVKSGY